MASNPPKQPPSKAATAGYAAALVALVGVPAAVILNREVPKDEGMVYRGYLDPARIPTKCGGDTTNVVVGRAYSRDECAESIAKQLYLHAQPVIAFAPALKGHPYATYAAVSFAYNIGAANFRKSLAGRHFHAGRLRAGCLAINNGAWQTGAGTNRKLPGLVKRRAKESALCMKEFAPA